MSAITVVLIVYLIILVAGLIDQRGQSPLLKKMIAKIARKG